MTENQNRKCGYVAVIGAPNAGKSTLVNQLVGQKVSIVSPKVQTTRNRIMGIVLEDNAQIILIDTPVYSRLRPVWKKLWFPRLGAAPKTAT